MRACEHRLLVCPDPGLYPQYALQLPAVCPHFLTEGLLPGVYVYSSFVQMNNDTGHKGLMPGVTPASRSRCEKRYNYELSNREIEIAQRVQADATFGRW